jgi:methylenetetrahydrofolate--tRNA-(uracil-5-)-methyltransferase
MWRAPPSATTALGALLGHITGGHLIAGKGSFQPMNINYGLLPPLEAAPPVTGGRKAVRGERARAKKRAIGARALADLAAWSDGALADAA